MTISERASFATTLADFPYMMLPSLSDRATTISQRLPPIGDALPTTSDYLPNTHLISQFLHHLFHLSSTTSSAIWAIHARRLYHLGKSTVSWGTFFSLRAFLEKSVPGKSWSLAKSVFLAKNRKVFGILDSCALGEGRYVMCIYYLWVWEVDGGWWKDGQGELEPSMHGRM
jgi:hypothetical protein